MPNGNGDALRQPRRPMHVNVGENWWTQGSMVVGRLALVANIFALYLARSPMREVEAMRPGSNAIIRQDTLGKPGFVATAEHLVLPLEWRNEKGGTSQGPFEACRKNIRPPSARFIGDSLASALMLYGEYQCERGRHAP